LRRFFFSTGRPILLVGVVFVVVGVVVPGVATAEVSLPLDEPFFPGVACFGGSL
jgi:hypothetical protein